MTRIGGWVLAAVLTLVIAGWFLIGRASHALTPTEMTPAQLIVDATYWLWNQVDCDSGDASMYGDNSCTDDAQSVNTIPRDIRLVHARGTVTVFETWTIASVATEYWVTMTPNGTILKWSGR